MSTVIGLLLASSAASFMVPNELSTRTSPLDITPRRNRPQPVSLLEDNLVSDGVLLQTQPTQAECEAMGVRDWPSTIVRAPYLQEECKAGALRYVLEGTGSVDYNGKSIDVAPNSLIKVPIDEDGASLRWVPDEGEMVLLTPEYQGPSLLATAGSFLLLCVTLVAATAGGL